MGQLESLPWSARQQTQAFPLSSSLDLRCPRSGIQLPKLPLAVLIWDGAAGQTPRTAEDGLILSPITPSPRGTSHRLRTSSSWLVKLQQHSAGAWAAASRSQPFCSESPCLSLNRNGGSSARAPQRGRQSHPQGAVNVPPAQPPPWGHLLLSPKSWPIPPRLTLFFPQWGWSEASSDSAAARWFCTVLTPELYLSRAGL